MSTDDWGQEDDWGTEEPPEAPAQRLQVLPMLHAGIGAAVDRAVQRRLDALAADALEEVMTDDVLADLAAAARAGATDVFSPDEPPSLVYASLPNFVEGFVAHVYARSFEGRERTWCPAWWKHTEAVVRLDAIWRAWEHLRKDPTLGMSSWLRDHGDPHMAVLMSSDGPLKGCSPAKGHNDRDWHTLPLQPPPPDLYETHDN